MSKTTMKLGDAGCSLILGGAIIEVIALILTLLDQTLLVTLPSWYLVGNIFALLLWALGLALTSVGAFGLRKQYGIMFPFVVGIIGLVVAATSTTLSGLSFVNPLGWGAVLGIVVFVLRGVFFILFGIAFILVREKTRYAGLSLTTGILAIITGALFCSVLLASIPVAQILLIPTMICAAILFWKEGGGGLI